MDFLDEDVITIPGQVYALISCVGPTGSQKADKVAVKIRGVFSSKEEAAKHVKRLMAADNAFHIYLVEVGKWLQVPPPNPDDIPEQEYSEKFLNDLMRGYRESQLNAKIHHEERKRAVMERGLDANLTPEEKLPAPTDIFTAPDPHPTFTQAFTGPPPDQ